MIVCPNCNHQNPEGATQCESCYTPLPTTTSCPNCGATVQADASFCGQCGYNLLPTPEGEENQNPDLIPTVVPPLPDLVFPDPIPDEEVATVASNPNSAVNLQKSTPDPSLASPQPDPDPAPDPDPDPDPDPIPDPDPVQPPTQSTVPPQPDPIFPSPPPVANVGTPATQLQQQTAKLVHVQSQTLLEIPQNLPVIHIGKPNDLVPPDIDVSGFANAEIVSRTHANIRPEGDAYYIEDVGSSNGTYINNIPLPKGNRHRLRPGDRIALGKGDMVSFIFQLS